MGKRDENELRHAIASIERRVQVIRLTSEAAEFVTNTGVWIEIMRLRVGWRVRAYRQGVHRERTARDVAAVLETARSMATRTGSRRV